MVIMHNCSSSCKSNSYVYLFSCSQVDPIVASFSGGAVGVISALMVVEVNNVKQQEHKRCKYCLGTGMVRALVLVSEIWVFNLIWILFSIFVMYMFNWTRIFGLCSLFKHGSSCADRASIDHKWGKSALVATKNWKMSKLFRVRKGMILELALILSPSLWLVTTRVQVL